MLLNFGWQQWQIKGVEEAALALSPIGLGIFFSSVAFPV